MKEVAKQIRDKLKTLGLKRSDYSVVCRSNYTIEVKTTNQIDKVKQIVEEIYYSKSHAWLCISINNIWLPITNKNEVENENRCR